MQRLRRAVLRCRAMSPIPRLSASCSTKYFYLFQASGLVLLTAMIGAIVLTLRHKPDVKRQVIADQNARTRAGAIEIKKVPSRTGV